MAGWADGAFFVDGAKSGSGDEDGGSGSKVMSGPKSMMMLDDWDALGSGIERASFVAIKLV